MPDEGPPGPRTPDAPPAPETVAPGALSALLAELVGAPEAPSPEPTPGTVIGRFELLEKLGAGGFGVVWEARDRQLGRKVAFKLIRPGERAELREESLLREAEAAARLSHDNIVALYDVGKCEYGPYLVLELLRGQTLADRLAGGAPTPGDAVGRMSTPGKVAARAHSPSQPAASPLTPAEAVRIVRDMTRGVAHAHAGGVVHRDLKPANVFLCDDGRVKVLDFGLAHAFGRRRQSGGTPAYMAPEQWKDAPEDERTDVFALGVILYQALTGALPFADEKEATSRRPAPSLEVAAAPELGPLVGRMLEKDPLKRPRDAGEVLAPLDGGLAALGAAGAGTGAGAPSSGTATMVRTRHHPRWRLTSLVAAGLAAGIALVLGATALRARTATVGGRLLIAVADIVNETGEKELDVLSGLLVTSLEQSRKLEVMTQARVLDLAAQSGRKGATRVDEVIGRAVALKSKATALLLPAIRKLGTTYAVELRAIDPVRDQHLFTVSDRASSRDGLFDLLDRLADRVRRELREDEGEPEAVKIRLGDAMTRSVEAYQHYLAGIEAWWRDGRRADGLRELSEAVRLDPQFAVAHGQLAILYGAYGRPDLAEPHQRAAEAFTGRMPAKERMLLRLDAASSLRSPAKRNDAEALRLADEVVARFQEDKFALAQAASAYAGVVMSSEKAEARLAPEKGLEAALRRALDLDAGCHSVAMSLVGRLIQSSRQAEALEVARRAVVTRRSAANVAVLAQALLASGDDAGAGAAARESLQLDAGQNSLVTGNACFVLAQLRAAGECLPLWERMMAEGQNEHERDVARGELVETRAVQGRIREALALLRSVDEARRGDIRWNAYIHEIGRNRLEAPEALAQARRIKLGVMRRAFLDWYGRVEEAEGVLLEPGERIEIEETYHRAFVEAHRGRKAEAVEGFRAYRQAMDRDYPLQGALGANYLLAEALLASGRPAEAAGVWPAPAPCRCRDVLTYANDYPRLALVRARAMEQLGRKGEAARELDGVLEFWKDADEDLPLLVEARAMRARLAATR
jgi:hypothetical protein